MQRLNRAYTRGRQANYLKISETPLTFISSRSISFSKHIRMYQRATNRDRIYSNDAILSIIRQSEWHFTPMLARSFRSCSVKRTARKGAPRQWGRISRISLSLVCCCTRASGGKNAREFSSAQRCGERANTMAPNAFSLSLLRSTGQKERLIPRYWLRAGL